MRALGYQRDRRRHFFHHVGCNPERKRCRKKKTRGALAPGKIVEVAEKGKYDPIVLAKGAGVQGKFKQFLLGSAIEEVARSKVIGSSGSCEDLARA